MASSKVLNISIILLLQFICFSRAFFIDLEALGFSSSSNSDSNSGSISKSNENSFSNPNKILFAAPSEQQLVEVESKTDPNKSVKLTLGELKQLILGSVKDMTPNPPPINIKISGIKESFSKLTSGSSSSSSSSTTTTTPEPPPMKLNKYKYKNAVSSYLPYDVISGGRDSDESVASYWSKPPMSYEDIHLYSNEVSNNNNKEISIANDDGEDDEGWFGSIRGPIQRWRSSSSSGSMKSSKPMRRRPLADITYGNHPPKGIRGRRPQGKRPRPPPRRPMKRNRNRSRNNRRGHGNGRRGGQRPYSSSSGGDYSEYAEYDSSYPHQPHPDDWDRVGTFDSTFPQDFTPMNMQPPMGPAPSSLY